MQWKDVQSNWAAYIPRMTTQWPELNEDDVQAIDGDQDAFINYLARVKGGDRVAAQMELADWLIGGEPIDAVMDETRDNEQIVKSGQNVPAGEDTLSDDRKFGAETVDPQPLKKTG